MSPWTLKTMPDQSGRVVVITGANSGVGYESAAALAAKGATVVMACRSADKAEEARRDLLRRVPAAKVDVLPLDLGSLASVRAFADAFNPRYFRLDILMNSAGIMRPPYGKTVDGFELQFGTNHLGHFALTGLLLPKLLATPRSRVVTVSSMAATRGKMNFADLQSEENYDGWNAYGQSKLANLLFTAELQRRLQAVHVDSLSAASHPGWTVTNLSNHRVTLDARLMRSLRPLLAMPTAVGAQFQLYAATSPDAIGGAYYGPRYMMRGPITQLDPPAAATDTADAARLWDISERLTGVRFDFQRQPAAVAVA